MADVSQTPASVLKSSTGQQIIGVAGATILAGNLLYIDTANSNVLKLADSNGSSPANSIAGMALCGASANQPVVYVGGDDAINVGAVLTAGATAYLSDTAGGLTVTYADILTGSTVIQLGVANTDGTLNFHPLVGGVKP